MTDDGGGVLTHQVNVRFEKVIFANLWARAQGEGTTVAEVVRRMVMAQLAHGAAEQSAGAVEDTLRRVLEPHVERLASLIALGVIEAGAAAQIGQALAVKLVQPGREQLDALWAEAHERARAVLRRPVAAGEEDEQ